MIYGYDEAIQLPVKDLYDSQIMMASINAAKQMYEKGEQAIKDFDKEYGDFFTPIKKDQEWYSEKIGGIQQRIKEMYEQGIDPIRTSEGRAEVQRLINSIPKKTISEIKAAAEIGKEFVKSRKKLNEAGLYNPEFQKYINNGMDFDEWSTVENGIWDIASATPYEDLTTFSNPQFDELKPSQWSFDKNGIKYKQEGITQNDLLRVARENFADLITSPQGSFLYNKLLTQTGDPNEAQRIFNDMIAGSQTRRLYSTDAQIDPDWFKLQKLNLEKQELDLSRQRLNIAKANAYRDYIENRTIFDSAKSSSIGKATYAIEDSKKHGITPVSNKVNSIPATVTINTKDANGNSTSVSVKNMTYEFAGLDNSGIYVDNNGKLKQARSTRKNKNIQYKFTSNGDLQYYYDGQRDRFFMVGKLERKPVVKGGKSKRIYSNTKDGLYYMEVKETRPNQKKSYYDEQIY